MSNNLYADGIFNRFKIDVKEIYKKYPINKKFNPKPNQVNLIRTFFHKIYRNSFLPLKLRIYFWYLFRRTNIDLSWFKEFSNYGNHVLYRSRRFLQPSDLFYLKNYFGFLFENLILPDTNNPNIHLESWQRPELVNQLFSLVSKEYYTLNYNVLRALKKKKIKFRSFLEFGCATTPITTALFEFFKLSKETKIFIADIQTIAFHYGAYKFRNCSNVIPLLLTPENDFLLELNEKIDLIFCLRTFEHLHKPLEIVKIFNKILNDKGYLIFDFIIPGGKYDTQHALRERNTVLDYIDENFEVISGKMSKE